MASFLCLVLPCFLLLHSQVADSLYNHYPLISDNPLLSQMASNPDIPEVYSQLLTDLRMGARPCKGPLEERYSRADGLCHNLKHPFHGTVLSPQLHLLSNTYIDGLKMARTKGVDNFNLPSAREVSRRCFGAEDDGDLERNERATQLVWQFGQFFSHDITDVQTFSGLDHCCDEYTPGSEHSDQRTANAICLPIDVASDDPAFNLTCMPFMRSFAVDIKGVRHPVNAATSYIDASVIYGSTFEKTDDLRLGSRGLLKTTRGDLLPHGTRTRVADCQKRRLVKQAGCPQSGDSRVNEQPGLSAMHTLFHMEHNRIARKFHVLNSSWRDERIFQETRKIIIAILQKIIYEEYLPIVLGDDVMDAFHLRDAFRFDESVDPGAQVEFTTAAFRFGHSLINSVVGDDLLHHQYFVAVEDGHDISKILLQQSKGYALHANNLFTNEVRERLFINFTLPDKSPVGVNFDLIALNIQRGRDHGIATYPMARNFCRQILPAWPEVIHQDPLACLADGVYRHESDIDLFVGGISERPLPNALVGPTFACLIGMQFEKLKFGDRYFYESTGPLGFTNEQMDFIKRSTLASLICERSPEERVQRDIFRPVSLSNPLVSCRTILDERRLDQELHLFGY